MRKLIEQDDERWTLRTVDGESLVVVKSEVEQFERSTVSLMPQGLTETLDSQQLRDLFGFLRLSQPLNTITP